jgi:hypothetical protein
MNFTKLKLDRNLIGSIINKYLNKKIEPIKRINKDIVIYRYKIDTNSILDIYYNLDTTTTLCPIGKNLEMAQLIALEIVEHCTISLPNPLRALYLKEFKEEDLNNVLGEIEKTNCTITNLESTDIAQRYEISNSEGEKIKIHYFSTTGSLNIQGKGYSLYNTILSSFDTLISLDDVISSNLSANNIENITVEELVDEMKKAFPNSFPFIKGTIANIISSSFFLTKIENENLPDYSWMIYPILRGLEGVIKKILFLKGMKDYTTFGDIFEFKKDVYKWKIKDCYSNKLGSVNMCSKLEECYFYFHSNRHRIFHIDNNINTTFVIDRREVAVEKFNEIVELIEETFLTYRNE